MLESLFTWENLAVVLAVSYLLLILFEKRIGWICAFISTSIYIILFWEVYLFMDAALNVYYLAMAVYGWLQWSKQKDSGEALKIHSWPWQKHALAISGIIAVSAISGFLLNNNTEAAWPYVDSFTTWASVFTTILVARKVLENWLYWIVIDGISVFVYLERGLTSTAFLFAAYVVIVIVGWFKWRALIEAEKKEPKNQIASQI